MYMYDEGLCNSQRSRCFVGSYQANYSVIHGNTVKGERERGGREREREGERERGRERERERKKERFYAALFSQVLNIHCSKVNYTTTATEKTTDFTNNRWRAAFAQNTYLLSK